MSLSLTSDERKKMSGAHQTTSASENFSQNGERERERKRGFLDERERIQF